MTDRSYSPGLWYVVPWPDGGGFYIRAEDGTTLAAVYQSPGHSAEANARVIAKAPLMLELLQELYDEVSGLGASGTGYDRIDSIALEARGL